MVTDLFRVRIGEIYSIKLIFSKRDLFYQIIMKTFRNKLFKWLFELLNLHTSWFTGSI